MKPEGGAIRYSNTDPMKTKAVPGRLLATQKIREPLIHPIASIDPVARYAAKKKKKATPH